jgi:hypothetical protein
MDSDPSATPIVTSRQLAQLAIRVHERLFRLLAGDEPDLGANVVFTLGRASLSRIAAIEPSVVQAAAAAEATELIEAAGRVADPRTAEAWFYSFPEQVIALVTARPPDVPAPVTKTGVTLSPIA